MVSIKSLATLAATGLLSFATASPTIYSLSTPKTAAAGATIKATLNTSIYIQNWEDFNIIWGIASPAYGGLGSDGVIAVGTQIGFTSLYGTNVEELNSFEIDITIPKTQPTGDWLVVAAVPYLVGASGELGINAFNSSITITA
ncbi:hypothetical protein F5Y16DRAFT_399922 [Xylariaceae sp. FL0255]|nr:hypothetical protein F5Y16DRAFT_399922 [Xylariaceae sp. FL0255]